MWKRTIFNELNFSSASYLAGVPPLSALVLIPAANPGRMGSEAGETGTGEAAHIVGAGRLYATVGGSIEQSVVYIALVNVHTLGLLQAGVADHPGHAVVVIAAANLAIAAHSVEFVAVPVAAVV